ncbi:glycosyltransferase family 2 protein [Phreatobacter aquaticus]|nr:glycosyltransferase family 2 protein [Phreatobacter aquaticus]
MVLGKLSDGIARSRRIRSSTRKIAGGGDGFHTSTTWRVDPPASQSERPDTYRALISHLGAATGRDRLLGMHCLPCGGIEMSLLASGRSRRRRAFSASDHDAMSAFVGASTNTVILCTRDLSKADAGMSHLGRLAAWYEQGAMVIRAGRETPAGHGRPRRSAIQFHNRRLGEQLPPPLFVGSCNPGVTGRHARPIVAINDPIIDWQILHPPSLARRPLAIMATYNEADIVAESVQDLLEQGCEVAVMDNWSTDRTWDILRDLVLRRGPDVSIERFPDRVRPAFGEWRAILARKAELARAHPGRWILHVDADEFRRAPFPGLTLAEGLAIASGAGATRVGFTLTNFRPIRGPQRHIRSVRSRLRHFEFGDRPGHYLQSKAWLQGFERVDLETSGGHRADFPGARDFGYKFLLQHYPIRSPAHGARKVLRDRQTRWSPHELNVLGWHHHYDHHTESSDFLWDADDLHAFDRHFWREHGLAVLTGLTGRHEVSRGA